MKKFNTIIERERKRQGLTNNKVAAKCGFNSKIMTLIERDHDITTKTLVKILDFLMPGWEKRFK